MLETGPDDGGGARGAVFEQCGVLKRMILIIVTTRMILILTNTKKIHADPAKASVVLAGRRLVFVQNILVVGYKHACAQHAHTEKLLQIKRIHEPIYNVINIYKPL